MMRLAARRLDVFVGNLERDAGFLDGLKGARQFRRRTNEDTELVGAKPSLVRCAPQLSLAANVQKSMHVLAVGVHRPKGLLFRTPIQSAGGALGAIEPLAGAARLAATDSGFAAQVNRGLRDDLDNRTHPERRRRMGAG